MLISIYLPVTFSSFLIFLNCPIFSSIINHLLIQHFHRVISTAHVWTHKHTSVRLLTAAKTSNSTTTTNPTHPLTLAVLFGSIQSLQKFATLLYKQRRRRRNCVHLHRIPHMRAERKEHKPNQTYTFLIHSANSDLTGWTYSIVYIIECFCICAAQHIHK